MKYRLIVNDLFEYFIQKKDPNRYMFNWRDSYSSGISEYVTSIKSENEGLKQLDKCTKESIEINDMFNLSKCITTIKETNEIKKRK